MLPSPIRLRPACHIRRTGRIASACRLARPSKPPRPLTSWVQLCL